MSGVLGSLKLRDLQRRCSLLTQPEGAEQDQCFALCILMLVVVLTLNGFHIYTGQEYPINRLGTKISFDAPYFPCGLNILVQCYLMNYTLSSVSSVDVYHRGILTNKYEGD